MPGSVISGAPLYCAPLAPVVAKRPRSTMLVAGRRRQPVHPT
ncbi:hypothetical protein OF001_U230066 [Pseudomonas sp. OF001]|nr:hypothetical protein OF001_U230066 [Pseudomonas sp. OF001]